MHRKRMLTSAPVLSVAVLAFVAAAWTVEGQMRDNDRSLRAFALSSEDGQEFDARITTTLPEAVTEQLSAHVAATPSGGFTVDTLQAHAAYREGLPEHRRAMLAYVGRVLSARNRFEEALPLLDALSAIERTSLDAGFAYAETLKNIGETDAARAAYRAHIEHSPNHQAGHINYAILLMRLDQHAQALPVLERAIEITSGRRKGKSYALLGMLHMELDRYALAELAFQQSIEFRPTHAPTWRRLAVAQARTGAFTQQQVVNTFERAAALSPGNGLIEAGLAEYYFSVGRFDDALAHFRNATRHSPEQAELFLDRSLNLLMSERPTAAGRVVRQTEELALTRSQARQLRVLEGLINRSASNLARYTDMLDADPELTARESFLQVLAHLELGNFEVAQSLAAGFDEASPYAQPAQFQLARHLYRNDRAFEARQRLAALVERNDQSPIFWLYLGRSEADPLIALPAHRRAHALLPGSGRMTIEYAQTLDAAGQFEPAIALLFAYLDTHPNETRALRALAQIFDANAQVQRAEQIYRIIHDLNTDDRAAGRDLADAQVRAGRFDAALVTLDGLIESEPSRIAIRETRVETLLRLGRTQEARRELQRILRLDPDNENARSMLADSASVF